MRHLAKVYAIVFAFILAFLFLTMNGCGGALLNDGALTHARQTAAHEREQIDQIADKLQATIDVERAAYMPVKLAALSVCKKFDPEGALCVHTLGALDVTDQDFTKAQDALDAYRKAGEGFDHALALIDRLIDSVQEMKKIVDSLKKASLSGE